MWKTTINKLKSIEVNLLQNKQYIDKQDAINLTSIDINPIINDIYGSNSGKLSEPSLLPNIKGFNKLLNDITIILNEAFILQQKQIILIRNEIQLCNDFINKNHEQLNINNINDDIPKSIEANLLGIDDLMPNNIINDWNQLPSAIDEEKIGLISNNQTNYNDRKVKVDIINKKLNRKIQDFYDTLQYLIDSKVYSLEIIKNIFHQYINLLINESQLLGVAHPLYRVNTAVKPNLASVYENRFLDVTEANELLDIVKNSWKILNSYSSIAIADRSLALNYSIAEKIDDQWIGYVKFGAGAMLSLWAFSECFNNERLGRRIWDDPTFSIFMCIGDLLLLLWMWGVSMHVWRIHNIDYIRLLSLQSTELENVKQPELIIYKTASNLTLLFLVIFIIFNKVIRGVLNIEGSDIIGHSLPIIMSLFFIYYIIFPYNNRKKYIWMFGQVVFAPFYPVTFRCGYIGDIFTSLVRVFITISFSSSYLLFTILSVITTNISVDPVTNNAIQLIDWWKSNYSVQKFVIPLLTLYPLWIRFMQCLRRSIETSNRWPHFANALKYSSAMSVIAVGTYHPYLRHNSIWITCFIFATIYQFIWDITMDWGIIVFSSSSKASNIYKCCGIALRDVRLYHNIWYYIIFMIINLFLRFAWILTLLPSSNTENYSIISMILYHLGPLIAAAEVMRRMVWGFFRLEYEQIEVYGVPDINMITSLSSNNNDKVLEIEIQSKQTSYDWYLLFPFITNIFKNFHLFGLSQSSKIENRARFIESMIFASIMAFVILSAAVTGLNYDN